MPLLQDNNLLRIIVLVCLWGLLGYGVYYCLKHDSLPISPDPVDRDPRPKWSTPVILGENFTGIVWARYGAASYWIDGKNVSRIEWDMYVEKRRL